jgi:hypothetical protein
MYFSRAEITKKTTRLAKGQGRPRDPIMEVIISIPGIAFATVTPYCLMLTKAPTYGWEEIDPQVINLLTSLNIGQGNLLEENVTPPPVVDVTIPLTPDFDMGAGFTAHFQRNKNDPSQVRAVVLAMNGNIVARGKMVPITQAPDSLADAITAFGQVIGIKM